MAALWYLNSYLQKRETLLVQKAHERSRISGEGEKNEKVEGTKIKPCLNLWISGTTNAFIKEGPISDY